MRLYRLNYGGLDAFLTSAKISPHSLYRVGGIFWQISYKKGKILFAPFLSRQNLPLPHNILSTVGSKNRLPAPQGRGASPKHLFFGEVEGRGTLVQRGKANGNFPIMALWPIPYPLTSQGVPLPTNRGKGSLGSRWSQENTYRISPILYIIKKYSFLYGPT